MSGENTKSDAVEQDASEKIPVDLDEAAFMENPEVPATAIVLAATAVAIGVAAAGSGSSDLDAAELPAPSDTSASSHPSASDLIDHRESVTA
ncbi:hypothetical protein [Natrinema sp. H-ect4]|uniref:hypothetical protein n=1 Tax=Natrinema sp. H-ect4 TaxID=3242699 RepID=UPI0035A854BD